MEPGTEGQENAQVQQQQENNAQSTVINTGGIDALEGLNISPETQKELEALRGQGAPSAETKQQNSQQDNVDKNNEGGTEEEKEGENKDNPENKPAAEKPDTGKKNVLGISTKKQPDKKVDIIIENPDQILGVINTKFGQDIKEIKDLPKFFESAEKWRADSQKVETLSTDNDQLKSILEGLPDEFLDAIDAHYRGEDYTKVILNKPKFDFNTPVEKQNIKDLVNHYFPGKFTDEDFTETEPSPALEIATQASQNQFKVEKQTRDNQRVTTAQNAQKQLEVVKASVGNSVNYLKQSFPDVASAELKEVQSALEGGPNAIVQRFFNNDGTVKQNAAEALMLAIHGKSVIQDMVNEASVTSSHEAETKAALDILERGNETRRPKHNSGNPTQISEATQKKLEDLKQFKKKTTF